MPSSPAFDTAYAKLNKAQKEAVDAIEGPVMVIAGPGTGKTTILTLRIANILKRTDTPAHGILAITFTDAGVKAMRAKLRSIIGDRAHEVHIFTFHAFASSVFAEHPDRFLHMADMKVMSDIEQESLIRSIIADPTFAPIRPAGKPDAYVASIIRSIDDSKREAQTPDMVRSHALQEADRIRNDESSISSRGATKGQLKADAREAIEKCERTLLFADVYERYEAAKKETKRMDFNDLLIELLLAMRTDELLLRLIQEKYLYIHVDEHQDTNDAQNFIVGLIAEFFDTPNIFIVGDEKQAIYRFQGASVDNFLLLQKRWPGMKLISLDTNYRSHQSILDASFRMIENNYEGNEHADLRIRLASGNATGSGKAVRVLIGEDVRSAEARLVEELRRVSAEQPQATVAIITRRNRDLDRVIRLLESAHIPVSSERSVDIFSHPVGRVFFDLLECLYDQTRIDALARTIMAGLWGLSFMKGAEIVRGLRAGQDIESDIPGLVHMRRMMLNDGAMEFLIAAAELSGYASLVARDPSRVHVWRGITALSESLARDGRAADPRQLIEALLAYRLSAESRTIKVPVGAPDLPIQAMTAHGSKGLEFDFVFIPYATEDAWVSKARGASFVLPRKRTADSDIRDVRRLFYVALTRARTQVTILPALAESDGKQLSPIRFIDELDPQCVTTEMLERRGAEESIGGHQVPGQPSAYAAALADISKHVLLEKGLSVTALNHFLECPSKFIYQSVLKMPQAPSAASEKGTAMHAAMDRVWRSQDKSVSAIEQIIRSAVSEYFVGSLLSANEKKAVLAELSEDAPSVARALEPHFAQIGAPYTELWVRAEHTGSYQGTPIRIPIHGKLDALIDTGSEALIYDYKTRQAMSVNAIKGETASANAGDGGYFRQLVYYKMLAQADTRWRGRRISPALIFISPDSKGRCPTVSLPIQDEDIEHVRKNIQSLIDSVWSGSIGTDMCADDSCEWCGMKKL